MINNSNSFHLVSQYSFTKQMFSIFFLRKNFRLFKGVGGKGGKRETTKKIYRTFLYQKNLINQDPPLQRFLGKPMFNNGSLSHYLKKPVISLHKAVNYKYISFDAQFCFSVVNTHL